MAAFLYVIWALIVIAAYMMAFIIVLIPICMFLKWIVVSLCKRYQERKSAAPQPHCFTLPDGRIRYLP